MEMVTAKPENANAYLIMSTPKIAQFMDVSSYSKPLCFFPLLYKYVNTYHYAFFLHTWTLLFLMDSNRRRKLTFAKHHRKSYVTKLS